MTQNTMTQPADARSRRHSAGDYLQLTRPRIVALELFTMAVAALVAAPQLPAWGDLLHALAGVALVTAGAIVLNQRIEGRSDALMPRTARRPLPAGRLSPRQVLAFGIVASAAGFAYLAFWGNRPTLLAAAAAWVIYVWVYTPLKPFTTWQTPIGSIAGAMPTLLGAAAAGAPFSPTALALFGVVFFWQFPHAMAIAWLYRREFAAADLKVATVVDPSGRTAALISLLGAVLLLPVSLAPTLLGRTGWAYAAAAAALGLVYLAAAVQFLGRRDDGVARRLLHASLIYLPLVFVALLLAVLA